MKIMKKISALLLTLCLVLPCFSLVAQAADGRISFTDPETAVGEMVEVKCVARSTSGSMSDMEIKFAYDSESLRFDSGSDVTDDGNGSLTYQSSGGSSEVTVTLTFQALKEGTAKVSITSSSIKDANGLSLDLNEGSSSVKIAAGDPSKITDGNDTDAVASASDKEIEVNGVTYTLTDEFADADIPNGYSRTQVALDGEQRQMVTNESESIYLAYLMDADKVGDFFLYNQEDATFAPYEEITISDTTSIIVLSDTAKVKLPKAYKKAKLTLNDKEFPVWQDTEHEGYYVIYAMNSNGEDGFYQYDSVEQTYQKVEIAANGDDNKKTDNSLMGKIQQFIEKNIQKIVLFGGLGAILVLLLIIILATKLHHRNAELDDLYDEYGIDEEEEEEEIQPVKGKAPKKEKRGLFGKKKKNDEDDFEEYDDDEDFDEYEDDEFEDAEYEYEDEFDEESYDVSSALDQNVFSAYDDRAANNNLSIDDLDDLLSERPASKRSHMEADDTFKVDFIDLD